MNLRILRTYKYVRDPSQTVRLGAPVPWMLAHTDVLQVNTSVGWKDVPIEELLKPEHPETAKRGGRAAALHAEIGRLESPKS